MNLLRRIASPILAFTLVYSPLSDMGSISKVHALEATAKAFYIAKNGNDANSGTMDAPFATLEKARDAIRELKSTSGLPDGGVTVYLKEGVYNRTASFALTDQDSGTSSSPITYRAYGNDKVSIMGGYNIDTAAFTPVTDQAILSRLPQEAKDKVRQIDLKAQGITEYGQISKAGYGWPKAAPAPELFVNGKSMTLARYPNTGFLTTGSVVQQGFIPRDHMSDMPAGNPSHPDYVPPDQWITKPGPIFKYSDSHIDNWAQESDPWLFGYWRWDWADDNLHIKSIDTVNKTIEASHPSMYGAISGQRYYAYNLLSEIDIPGEWYLDRTSGILYLYPEKDVNDSEMQLSVLDTPLVDMKKTDFTNFMDITFEVSRGHGIKMVDSSNNRIVHCTFRRLGQKAIMIGDEEALANDPGNVKFNSGYTGGSNNGVISCDIYDTGQGGIYMLGGNRSTLTPGGHYAENNHIYRYARILRTYTPAISLNGVGIRATNNLIHDAPHMAIQFKGNDHVIEFNEIYDVCQETSDAGVIYSLRDWTYRGNMIKNNYIHDITNLGGLGSYAVYLDDLLSSAEITGNVFYNVSNSAFLLGGGRDNTVKYNIMIDSGKFMSLDNRGEGWAAYHAEAPNGTAYKNLMSVPYKQEPWASKYPQLVNLWEDSPKIPKGNVVKDNVLYNTAEGSIADSAKTYGTIGNNLKLTANEDAGFVDKANRNFKLKDSSIIYQQIPDFPKIPFDKMGLKLDEYRTSIDANIGDFHLTTPANHSTNLDPMNVVFEWQKADGGEGYELIVAEDEAFTKIISDVKLNGTRKAIDGLEANKTYYWKVKAYVLANSVTGGKWSSEVYTFTTGASSTFTEDFENGFAGWTAEKGTPSTSSAQAHSGTKSYVKDENVDAISKTFSNYYNGFVTVWYYDNMSGATKQLVNVEGGKWIALGVDTTKTASSGGAKYQIRIDGDFTSSGVDRTKGWHKFTWDYTSGDHVDLYIDDQKVATADSKSFNKIAMGDFWGAAGIGYFDDIKIENLRVAVKGVALSKPSMELEAGGTESITATVTPNAAANKNVTWKSSNDAIVSVDQNGVMTAHAEGTATITVTTADGGYTADCTVTVKQSMPRAALTGPKTVNSGQTLDVTMGLSGVTQNVYQQMYGQDLTLTYDPVNLQFESVTSVRDGFQVIDHKESVPGQIRIVAASVGTNVSAQGDLLLMRFKTKSVTQATYTTISIDRAVIANGQGDELQVGGASHEVQIQISNIPVDKSLLNALIASAQAKYAAAVEGSEDGQYITGSKGQLQSAIDTARVTANDPNATQQQVDRAKEALEAAIHEFDTKRITADINGDGIISIGDLAIVAGAYGKQQSQTGWNAKTDVNHDGKVDIVDLAIVAKAILK
ncbi:Ig-like domain-containing protein [Paenibacillus sp. GCM10027629]|uniref:Ig-like domain-containing protein n=1 Tax=Paenibacillus sp. GCM10027629 TaxID=3273414 RepID=UPI00362A6748